MTDSINFDFDELNQLVADLESAPKAAEKLLTSALKVTSTRVKKSTADKVKKRRHFRQAASAIDYEITTFSGFGTNIIQAEIGYDKDRPAGELGNIIEFGAPKAPNAITPGNELQTTLHEEEDDFVKGIERAIDDAHREAGL